MNTIEYSRTGYQRIYRNIRQLSIAVNMGGRDTYVGGSGHDLGQTTL